VTAFTILAVSVINKAAIFFSKKRVKNIFKIFKHYMLHFLELVLVFNGEPFDINGFKGKPINVIVDYDLRRFICSIWHRPDSACP
jgi:hypothetical protein